jgi:isoamylase
MIPAPAGSSNWTQALNGHHNWHVFVPGVKAGQLFGYRVHGPSDLRQVKNFLTVTLLSLGVPMILMGDEVRHTQGGNTTTPIARTTKTSWFDWTLLEKHADVHRFLKLLAARHLLLRTEHELQRTSLNRLIREANKAWHGVRLNQPDWSDHSHSVAFTAEIRPEKLLFHLILNACRKPLDFELPSTANDEAKPWRRWIDTAQETPNDIVPWEEAPAFQELTYRAEARSVVVLYAHGR